MRSLVPLLIGLIVGGVGATMFVQSLPGAEGSPEERANKLELELKRAQNRIAALEAASSEKRGSGGVLGLLAGGGAKDSARTLADGARKIGEDLREGRPVSPEDIFRVSQPLMRDLAPLFDRMRVKQQQQLIDSMTGELARKYDLTPQNQEQLKQWFQKKSEEEAKRWNEMMASSGTRLQDVMRAAQDIRPDEGLDSFMPSILPPDKLESFKTERLAERAERLQREADMRVQRLDAVVGLDETQRDQVFGIMARTSRDYHPDMVLEGAQGEIGVTPGGDRQTAMLSVLRPEQRVALDAERQRRREAAAKDLEAIGLALPPDWDMFDESTFR